MLWCKLMYERTENAVVCRPVHQKIGNVVVY